MRPFAERCRRERIAAGLSQKDLEDKAELGRTSVQKYETDKVVPSLYAAARIADILNVSLDWLAGM